MLTFLKLGNVFTSAMTGNTTLLAIEIGRWDLAVSRALMALLAFALGVALAALMSTARQRRAGAQPVFRLNKMALTVHPAAKLMAAYIRF